jgi:hypothetical protein
VKSPAAAKKPVTPAKDDSESSDSDDSSSAEDLPAISELASSHASGVKRKAEEDDSSDEEDSDSDGDETAPQAKRARSEEVGAPAAVESSDSEESDDEEMPDAPAPAIAQPAKAAAPTVIPSSQAIPARPYDPPAGYRLVESVGSPSANSSLFSESALEGKQIWHIIAPTDVPLSALTSLSLSAINSTTPIFTHNDTPYILRPNPSASIASSVLLPQSSTYTFAPTKVMSTLQLQAQVDLPNLSRRQADLNTGSSAAANIAQASLSTIRPQPKGLRMRYRPPGFGTGEPGRIGVDGAKGAGEDGEDDEDENDGQALQFPHALGAHTGRLRPDTSDTIPSPVKARKSKKRKEGVESLPSVTEIPIKLDDDAAAKALRKEAKRKKKQEAKTQAASRAA